ncbi:hypothetical protein [Nocardioides sp. GY 10127]|uniref:hypothetical protein n=1 Tax=Nocardioides sp. GY 10127 TaxID=2569762 RepID=UPI0010A89039|nr:hypothetical protein [Nocardioides sp. GY 10127]TIC80809.1 hypothetical protein E8D37_13210 [Nocardioides sp. GY 10127]
MTAALSGTLVGPSSQASGALLADVRARLLPLAPAGWLLAEVIGVDPIARLLDELAGGYDRIDVMAQAWDAAGEALSLLADDHRDLAAQLPGVWQGLAPVAAAGSLRAAADDLEARARAVRQVAACLRCLLQAIHDLCVLAADLVDEALAVGLTSLALGPVGSGVKLLVEGPRLVSLARSAVAAVSVARGTLVGLLQALAALEAVMTVTGDLAAGAGIATDGAAAVSLAWTG